MLVPAGSFWVLVQASLRHSYAIKPDDDFRMVVLIVKSFYRS